MLILKQRAHHTSNGIYAGLYTYMYVATGKMMDVLIKCTKLVIIV